ncbi:NUDIX hydrolase [Sphingomonas sp. 8AM]|uniref:NUDIX hydrolase n=1 Tax=Sphingomonas sp. 8AM TaxID=2653170 RepID=UPI0012F086D5|nr:NUDIX domain-containing protein [Sphingomonas sp. 8AM]VXD01277.1 ADP-ribose pyrophosphatase YjhB, NUDIX family [Sphingomonas sp. 8AM]
MSARAIRIAAALIEDGAGRLLLVRKAGTGWFMQAGGKIEDGESAVSALRCELVEEIGLVLAEGEARHLGRYAAPAANEPGHIVDADIFHVRTRQPPAIRSEIEAAVWVDPVTALALPLAPLTRDHILPLFRAL